MGEVQWPKAYLSKAPMRSAGGRRSKTRHREATTVTIPGGVSDANPIGGRPPLQPRAQGPA
eukprot:5903562-Lingulodinium_polyedra.AAC.1